MCHTGATHSGTKQQARRSPVVENPYDSFGDASIGGGAGTALLDAPLPPERTRSSEGQTAKNQSQQERKLSRKERRMQSRQQQTEGTGNRDSVAQAPEAKLEAPKPPVSKPVEPQKQQLQHRPTRYRPQRYARPEPIREQAPTPVERTPILPPVRPVTRSESFGGAQERKIINLTSTASRKPIETPTQPVQRDSAVILKAVTVVLTQAIADEKRYAQQGRSYQPEISGRLARLHTLLFQGQPLKANLSGSEVTALKSKIVAGLRSLTGDGFSQLELPRFLKES